MSCCIARQRRAVRGGSSRRRWLAEYKLLLDAELGRNEGHRERLLEAQRELLKEGGLEEEEGALRLDRLLLNETVVRYESMLGEEREKVDEWEGKWEGKWEEKGPSFANAAAAAPSEELTALRRQLNEVTESELVESMLIATNSTEASPQREELELERDLADA